LLARLDELKPQRVVVDSLSELRLMAQDPLRYRRLLLALRKYFDDRGVTALLVDFTTNAGDTQLESLCHGIIRLDQLVPEYGGQRRRLRISKLRESSFRDCFHDFDITTGGIELYPRLVAAEHDRRLHFTQDTMSTGLPEMDKLLGGGVDRSTSTLILGPAGSGKSTLAAQFAKASVERGEKAAFFIFDEVPNTLIVRGEGLGMGVREHIEAGRISIRQIDPAELSPGHFAHLVRQAVEKDKVSYVAIDSINGYQSAMPEEHHLSAHLHELLAYLNQRQIVTVLVMTQSGILTTSGQAPIDLSYLADTVILLRYFEAHAEIRQAISCVKRRTGAHERTIRELRIDHGGLRIGEPLHDFHGVMTGHLVYSGGEHMFAGARAEIALMQPSANIASTVFVLSVLPRDARSHLRAPTRRGHRRRRRADVRRAARSRDEGDRCAPPHGGGRARRWVVAARCAARRAADVVRRAADRRRSHRRDRVRGLARRQAMRPRQRHRHRPPTCCHACSTCSRRHRKDSNARGAASASRSSSASSSCAAASSRRTARVSATARRSP
jgi:circadian clock protein KaiC